MATESKQGRSKPRKEEPRCVTEQQVFPTRLRELMEEHNTTQKELAKAIDMRPQTVSLYTGGQSTPDINCLYKIADYFNVTADWLIGRPNSVKSISKDVAVAVRTTGLSESAISKLQELRHSRYGSMEGDAVVIGGNKAIVLISLVNDLIEADKCRSLFTHIAGFLEYGGAFQTEDDSNIDLGDVDLEKAKVCFRAKGKEVVLRSDVSELCLQLASEKLKDIFRGVLEKEVKKNGKH